MKKILAIFTPIGIIFIICIGCGQSEERVETATVTTIAHSSLKATPPSTVTAIMTLGSTNTTQFLSPSTPVSNKQKGYLRPCILVKDGYISGTVTHAGSLVPDGTFVSLVFEGGPLQKAQTKNGYYSLPLLALKCGDGTRWIPFVIYAGFKGQAMHPNRSDVSLNLEAKEVPTSVPPDTPICKLVLGKVKGEVTIGEALVPNGTVVSAKVGPGLETLTQIVFTTNGQYELASIGSDCEGIQQFLTITLSVLKTNVTITPTQDITHHNIAIP
ncbi:MAG: hypothetical protein KDJ52_08615 [Anaerolineae bacterium]|nr:hypothetical protein [Anaerolineae bacterium]